MCTIILVNIAHPLTLNVWVCVKKHILFKKKKPSVSIITKTVYYFCHEEFGYLIQSL